MPNDHHELTLALAVFGTDERVAYARLQFAASPVVRWVNARPAGPDVAVLRPGERFGYGVDSGTGCFADPAAYADIAAVADVFNDMIIAAQAVYQHTRVWLTVTTDAGSFAMFSSGYGDGFYSSYFGFDAVGSVVALLTDFDLFDWPDRPAT